MLSTKCKMCFRMRAKSMHSNGLLNVKVILVEEQRYYLTDSWGGGDKGVSYISQRY